MGVFFQSEERLGKRMHKKDPHAQTLRHFQRAKVLQEVLSCVKW
jgi:hypothetical protein